MLLPRHKMALWRQYRQACHPHELKKRYFLKKLSVVDSASTHWTYSQPNRSPTKTTVGNADPKSNFCVTNSPRFLFHSPSAQSTPLHFSIYIHDLLLPLSSISPPLLVQTVLLSLNTLATQGALLFDPSSNSAICLIMPLYNKRHSALLLSFHPRYLLHHPVPLFVPYP